MRVALRVARRSLRRHLWRSLLIIALIALPVAGATVLDGLVRATTDRDVEVDRLMGTADARIDVSRRHTLDVEELLPAGSRAVPISAAYYTGSIRLVAGDRIVRSRLDMVVLGDPLTTHLARLTAGRLPRTSDETLVTEALADRLGLRASDGSLLPHATLTVEGAQRVAVTGLAVKPYCLRCADIVVRPDNVLVGAMLDGSPKPLGYLVDVPDGTDLAALARNWPVDVSTIATRDTVLDSTPFIGYVSDAAGEPATLFAGLGLIGIVVMAGAAFGVGARQQVRELGLVAVNGGTARHIRRIVLAQGLFLGVLGASTGLLVGAAVTVLGVPLWQGFTDQLIENLRFGWVDLGVAALVGVGASVAASAVPAYSVARMTPLDALAGRFRASMPTARLSRLGVVLVLAGAATVIGVGWYGRHEMTVYKQILDMTPDQTLTMTGALAGTAAIVAGLVLLMPGVVTAAGRLGGRLPLTGRLAVRDAVRHRHRTVASGAAVMVTVAGSVVAAFVFAGARMDDDPKMVPDNTLIATLDGVGKIDPAADGPGQVRNAVAKVNGSVPGASAQAIQHVEDLDGRMSTALLPNPDPEHCAYGTLGVGTPEMIELATGRAPDAATRAALADGEVAMFDDCLVRADGTVVVGGAALPVHKIPGPSADYYDPDYSAGYDADLPTVFVSPELMAEHGWRPAADSVAVTYRSPEDVDAVRTAIEDAGMDVWIAAPVRVDLTGLYLMLAGLAALVALLGAGVTVALSAADSRPDLATLAALGARPRHRRLLSGAHALVVTSVGTLAGVVLGSCVGFVAMPVLGATGFAVPWQHLSLTVLAVPLLASVVSALVTPSRLAS
jgi:putative ABC transport system permease protein